MTRIAIVCAMAPALTVGAAAHGEELTVFPVGKVEIRYAGRSRELVPVGDLMSASVRFARSPGGELAAPVEGSPSVELALRSFDGSRTERVDASGIRSMLEAVRDEVHRRTGFGVYVVPDPDQIALRGDGVDYRAGGSALTIVIYTSGRMAAASSVKDEAPPPVPAQQDAAPAAPVPAAAPRPSEEPREPAPVRAVAAQPKEPAPAAVKEEPRAAPAPAAAAKAPEEAPAAPDEAVAPAAPAAAPAPAPAPAPRPRRLPGNVVKPAEVPLSQTAIDAAVDGETPISMTGFEYMYARPHPDLPSFESIGDATVRLVRTPGGFVARADEGSLVRLGDLGADGPANLYRSAVNACMLAIVNWFGEQSVAGVYVVPDFDRGLEMFQDGELDDFRDQFGLTTFPIRIYSAQVSRVKTIASGDRVATEDRLNSKIHARIAADSPLQPYAGEGARSDLLRLEPLNTYAYRLSRHPGRRVDVAVADARDPSNPDTLGDAEVQYLVQEIKPWTVYFQLSNTGTEETNEWRERFGFVHNQLFGFDDILTVDYITADFRDSHALLASYNIPLNTEGTVRLNMNGGWTRYKASDVGVQDESFSGESFFGGAELSVNIFQRDDFFIDAYGGARYHDIEVVNEGLADGVGRDQIMVAEVGLRAERRRAEYQFGADVGLGVSLNDISGADKAELELLGRLDPDEDWTVLNWGSDLSFYLDGVGEWNPRPSRLVHELAFRFSGQYAFNNRFIPNEEIVGGGLYTVRGYPESAVAGDTGVFGSVEYRFHLPRALPDDSTPPSAFGKPFRVAPDGAGGRPDWDLVLKTFFDIGRITNSQRLGFERDETLMSTGLGAELVIANNLSFRTDWGIVLDEIGSDTPQAVSVGSQRWHFVFTVLY
jgi:hemolysin activation/secretion protein